MIERHEDGLKSAARFAIQPNMWGFCGEDSSQEILRNYVSDRSGKHEIVRETLKDHGFPHLNSFLTTIAEEADLDIYDEEVVMSYWLGSYLTEKVGTKLREALINNYKKRFSDEFAQRLDELLPEEVFLTHLSQVALVASVDYEQTEKTQLINHCMIAYGKIIEIDFEKRSAVVKREVLKKNIDQGYDVQFSKQTVKIDTDLTPQLEIGDDISVHLGYLAAKISPDQSERLRYWTKKVAGII